jgi:glycosyltransferase involved in cell wall biosynthesis
MRVAIEAASLALSSGGLARYTSELSIALARCFPDDRYVLTSDQPFELPAGASSNLTRGGGPRNTLERRWWLWGLPREMERLGVDVIHGPDFAVPYLNLRPSVLTLHDLSPWLDPAWHDSADRVRRRTPVLLELGLATMVITPSQTVRRQAIDRFRLRPERVVAVPEAAAAVFRPTTPPARAPYFLFAGTLEPRKNLPILIEAWREVRQHCGADLVIVGRLRHDGPRVAAEPGLDLVGEVCDSELARLYSGTTAFIYPSLYEGFGLPVLEAMQCGACVIASRAVTEAGGNAAVYFETGADLANAMRCAAGNPTWRAARQACSLERASEFSWDRTARRTHEVYEEARCRFGN